MQVWQALKSAVGETASVESVSSRTHWKRHCGVRPAPLDVVAFLGRELPRPFGKDVRAPAGARRGPRPRRPFRGIRSCIARPGPGAGGVFRVVEGIL